MLSAATACSATKVSGSSTPYSAHTERGEQPQRILRKQGKARQRCRSCCAKRPRQARQALACLRKGARRLGAQGRTILASHAGELLHGRLQLAVHHDPLPNVGRPRKARRVLRHEEIARGIMADCGRAHRERPVDEVALEIKDLDAEGLPIADDDCAAAPLRLPKKKQRERLHLPCCLSGWMMTEWGVLNCPRSVPGPPARSSKLGVQGIVRATEGRRRHFGICAPQVETCVPSLRKRCTTLLP